MNRQELIKKAVVRGKYAPLYNYLSRATSEELEMTFEKLEAILGFTLPDSARIYRPWWANQSKSGHSQSMAWAVAGWKTANVDLEEETLNFIRTDEKTEGISENGETIIHTMVPTQKYWVYENWTHNRAMIHEAGCSFCRNGVGMHAGSTNRNGRWHGPFDSIVAAAKKAECTGRAEIRNCSVCVRVDEE